MADVKISALPLATTPLAGTEVLPIVQSATTDQVSVANLTAGRAVSAASLTLTTTPLAVGSGGTGLTSLAAGYIPYGNGTGAFSNNNGLTYDGTTLTLGSGSGNPVLYIHGAGSGTATGPAVYFKNAGTVYNAIGTQSSIIGGSNNNSLYLYNTGGDGIKFGSSGYFAFGSAVFGTEFMRLDASGNLGLGVTPSAWSGVNKVFEFGGSGVSASLFQNGANDTWFCSNTYFNGSSWIYKATGTATQYYQNGGAHKWFTAASGSAGSTISFTQAMTLDASGRLGIGTGSPAAQLDVVSSTTAAAQIRGSSGYNATLDLAGNGNTVGSTSFQLSQLSDSSVYIYQRANAPMVFGTNNTERARIDASGNLLVQATNASDSVDVGHKILANATQPTYAIVGSGSANTGPSSFTLYSTGAAAYRFYVGYGGTIFATNTTISAISDQRFKENIVDLDVGLDAILSLKPRKFDWKAGKGKDIKGDRGFIAQEFEQIFPDLIDDWKDPAPEGEEPYKSVRPDLIPILVKAIQELAAKVQALEAKVQ